MKYQLAISLLIQKATEQAKQALAVTPNANYGVGFAEGWICDAGQYFIYCCCTVVSNSREIGTCVSDRIHMPEQLYQECLSGRLKEADIEDYVVHFYPSLYRKLVRKAIQSMQNSKK